MEIAGSFLTPTWTNTNENIPNLGPVPGKDALWNDLEETISQARSSGIQIAVFPQASLSMPDNQWWQSAPKDFSWWVAWFESYRTFILNYADLCAKTNASAMVIGGDWVLPALPDGKLIDGASSSVPADAGTRWEQLIGDIRARFSGQLIWAMPFSVIGEPLPSFVKNLDQIYVLFSEPVASSNTPILSELEIAFAEIFDNILAPWQQAIAKPIILGVSYASTETGASLCSGINSSGCIIQGTATQSGSMNIIDLQTQADIYSALMVTVNQRPWINGFVSRGFFPPVTIQDGSSSINGKPASEVLTYWFSRLGQ